MNGSSKFAFAIVAMAFGQQLAAQSAAMDALSVQDVRLATVAERLLAANRDLCRQHMPLAGMILHSQDQYRASVSGDAFANGRIAVEALVPGSAASVALSPGDAIAAIGSTRVDTLVAKADAPLRDSAFDLLTEQPDGAPLALAVVHDGRERTVMLDVPTGCRALVEIRSVSGLNARSDGRVIQVNYGLAAEATDEELAVVFAHEMGHLVLEHRRRLSSAGVEKGFFGEFGRNQQLNRQVEVEADRIAAHLLANAGYDPSIAPKFWRSSLGRRASGGLLRSSTYPSAEARAELIEREIAEYIGAGAGPSWPGHLLARRDTPFE
jgi:Zn-dependent protease with chaperone function